MPVGPAIATIEAPGAKYERLLAMLGKVDPATARRLDAQLAALASEREGKPPVSTGRML
jgi:hypothetical protein